MIIDLPSDKGLTHFHSLSRVLNLPEFVKEADFQEQIETKELPNGAFADPRDKKFPIHTKAAAYLSYAYFLKQLDKLSEGDIQRCDAGFAKAASYWSLKGEYLQIQADMLKQAAAPVEKYAAPGNLFPINTPSEIIKSAELLSSSRSRFDYGTRNLIAKNLMKAAAEKHLVNVMPESVHKMAGKGVTTKQAAMLELTSRYNNEKRPALAAPLQTCISALSQMQSDMLGGEVCEKIASIIDKYDRMAGKTSFPEDVLFAFTKHAATKLASSLVNLPDGTSYRLNDLEKAADAFDVFGANISKSLKNMDGTLNLTKVSELIDTLPRTDGDMLKDALEVMGVKPFTMDKHAMVAMVVSTVQPKSLVTLAAPIEKRSSVLAKMELADPLVKRALDTLRRLKEAKHEGSPLPRGTGGLFMNKAPNQTTVTPAK